MIRLEPTSRHPIVIYLLLLLAFSGARIMLGAPAPGSVESVLPLWGVVAWGACLALGAVSTLVGLYLQARPNALTGAMLEQIGMACLGTGGGIYALVMISFGGGAATIPAGLIAGLAASCVYRYWTIRGQLKAYAAISRGVTDAGEP